MEKVELREEGDSSKPSQHLHCQEETKRQQDSDNDSWTIIDDEEEVVEKADKVVVGSAKVEEVVGSGNDVGPEKDLDQQTSSTDPKCKLPFPDKSFYLYEFHY